MGIVFDARKFNSKRSPNGELSNAYEISRIVYLAVDALEGSDNLSFKLNKNLLSIKGKRSKFSGDQTFNSLKIKGSFGNIDPENEKTWKSATVDQIQYKGREGIINIREIGDKGSLGTLYDWDNTERVIEFLFRGDDIIYSDKNVRTDHNLRGYGGDDIMYLYGGESAEGGKGKDKFVVTKEAVKYMQTKRRDVDDIFIDDASSSEGDTVEILGNPKDFSLYTNGRQLEYETDYGEINIESKRGRVLADFVAI